MPKSVLGDPSRAEKENSLPMRVPTMIAGIYGMNFQYMPELEWHYGYFAVLGLIAVIMVGLYVGFKRNRCL